MFSNKKHINLCKINNTNTFFKSLEVKVKSFEIPNTCLNVFLFEIYKHAYLVFLETFFGGCNERQFEIFKETLLFLKYLRFYR